jgi:hypothetical protein
MGPPVVGLDTASAFGFRPLAINVHASSSRGLNSEMKQAER